MKKLLVLIFLVFCANLYAQEQLLCPWLETSIKIENEEDILLVTTNGDGTLTLTHPTDEDITNIFNGFDIFVFERTFPNAQSEELVKWHTLGANSKQVFSNLRDNVPDTVYTGYEFIGLDTAINSDFIDLVDGREFRLSRAISTTDIDPCDIDCEPVTVPLEINITVGFSYNPDTDLLTMESTEETSCGNSFSINLSGGVDFEDASFDDFTLQTWAVNSGTQSIVDFDEACFQTELLFYNLFTIYCANNGSENPNFRVVNINSAGIFQLVQRNPFFGEDRLEFRDVQLSIEENFLENIYVYQIKNNPFLQIHNPNGQQLSLEVFDILGRQIVEKTNSFEDIQLAQLDSKSLYLVRISDTSINSKVFKFIKR